MNGFPFPSFPTSSFIGHFLTGKPPTFSLVYLAVENTVHSNFQPLLHIIFLQKWPLNLLPALSWWARLFSRRLLLPGLVLSWFSLLCSRNPPPKAQVLLSPQSPTLMDALTVSDPARSPKSRPSYVFRIPASFAHRRSERTRPALCMLCLLPPLTRSRIVSFLSLILSIPALIGAWCWPALIMGLISGVVTEAARTLGHWISFGLTMVMMYGLAIYVYCHRRKRVIQESHWKRWGPFYLTLGAAFLVNLDPTRHILQDLEWWPAPVCRWPSSLIP